MKMNNMKLKVPTQEDFENYDGLHCHRLWAMVGDYWICPSCKRNKYQIMRWAKRFPNSPNAFYDWVAILHKHHDHSQGYLSLNNGRFPQTVICDQCNSADGAAKRKLSLPKDFSFSPEEIGRFVKATPHGKHEIDYEIAKAIYDAVHI
ncbi:hypothetical protein WCX49_04890 [Sulfurimonas sp. HSL-1656]|uniref:hypothetical protein n=1 Tax=Thiomicrolovo subterrani TaxID=3131934 RepID=UPI0031F96A33